MSTAVNLRNRTIVIGAIPVIASALALGVTTIPGTSINLSVPYAAEGPGPTFNTLGQADGKDVVKIEGTQTYPTSGNLNMTTVSVRHGMTLPQAISRWVNTDDTMVPIEQVFPSNKSQDEVNRQNAEAFATSEINATVAAMNYLKKPLEVVVSSLPESGEAAEKLQKDDVIVAVDGKKISKAEDAVDEIRNRSVGDDVRLTIRRGDGAGQGGQGGQEQDVTLPTQASPQDKDVPVIGVGIGVQPADGTKIEFNLNDIGGPSAGLMFTLAVIDKLTPEELTNGKFIAGTGTIDADGSVGPIGGITHKIDAARTAGATVFLTPSDNCSEAMSGNHDGVKLVKVDTLDDAVKGLSDLKDGKTPQLCSAK